MALWVFVISISLGGLLIILLLYFKSNQDQKPAPQDSQSQELYNKALNKPEVEVDKPQQPETPKPQQPETPKPQPGSNLKYPPRYFYTDGKTETTGYKSDRKTVWYIDEYDQETGNKIKQTVYQSDGKTIDYIIEYDQDTGKRIKQTKYYLDGKTALYIVECDKETGKQIDLTFYNDKVEFTYYDQD